MMFPSQPFWFHHTNDRRRKEDITKLLIMQIHQRPSASFILGPNILFSNLFLNTLILFYSLTVINKFHMHSGFHVFTPVASESPNWTAFTPERCTFYVFLNLLLFCIAEGKQMTQAVNRPNHINGSRGVTPIKLKFECSNGSHIMPYDSFRCHGTAEWQLRFKVIYHFVRSTE
jgi:hypothetical protein